MKFTVSNSPGHFKKRQLDIIRVTCSEPNTAAATTATLSTVTTAIKSLTTTNVSLSNNYNNGDDLSNVTSGQQSLQDNITPSTLHLLDHGIQLFVSQSTLE